MKHPQTIVTGAYGYTGRYIARRLLTEGWQVSTLTGHTARPDPFGGQVPALPFDFDRPDRLASHLEGADVLYNTYWVRFNFGKASYQRAVENSRTLIRAAEAAGVHRIVHISITHADPDSPLPYFRGKGMVEAMLQASRLPHAILRPTVIFGREDILINNIAWLLRRFPVFAVPGSGRYRLQPIYVDDLAELAVWAGARDENLLLDAAGPQVYPFEDLVRLLAKTVRSRARIVHLPPALVYPLTWVIGRLVRDVVLTRDEIRGLMAGLLVSSSHPPATEPHLSIGKTTLETWLAENAETVGRNYASELRRHYLPARAG